MNSKVKTKAKDKTVSGADTYTLPRSSEDRRPAIVKTPIPENETARLDCLHKSQILNHDPDELFDDLVDLAAHICIAPYAMISLVESDYIWYKSMVGLTSFESLPREGAFDSWTIASKNIFVIEDARQDIRFNFHPLVTAHPRIRFYAAAPLITSEGHAIGTLCVMDWRPRPLKPLQEKVLRTLAQDVVLQIELRRKNKELEWAIAERDHLASQVLPYQVAQSQELASETVEAFEQAAEQITSTEQTPTTEPITTAEQLVTTEPITTAEQITTAEPITTVEPIVTTEPILATEQILATEPIVTTEQTSLTEPIVTTEQTVQAEHSLNLDAFSKDGLWEWQLTTNQVIYSKKWKAMLGYEEHEIGFSLNEWFNRIHPEDAEKLHLAILDHLSGSVPYFKVQHRILGSDGVYRRVQSRGQVVLGEDGKPSSIFGVLTIVETSNQAEDKFKHSAYYDALTGLPNRMMFLKRLRRMLERSKRGEGNPFAVLLLDIDRFKVINDTYGQPIGDQLLRDFAHTLETAVSSEDIVARLEGDRFALLLDKVGDVNEAIIAADRLKKAFAEHYEIEGNEIFVSAGIGISHSLDQNNQSEDLFRNAEAALGRAKEQGRDGCEAFNLEMFGRMVALSRVETGLHKAIQRQEFEVYYQPVISLQDYKIIGFEALLRWQHPEQGLILPNDFIPIAEETGQIVQVDNWVLSEAAKQVCRWQAEFPSNNPLTVSVNISGRSFLQKDLIDHIKEVLANTGVRPECLKLEITESSLVEHADAATVTLMKIKDLGLQVFLDDFGKGYSSFNYLQQFPVDALKIDHSFVSTMNTPKSLQIVRGMMMLANSLGLKVVAEGVENSEQVIQLSEMDCKYVQGFLFSRPVPVLTATDLLAQANQLASTAQLSVPPALLNGYFQPKSVH